MSSLKLQGISDDIRGWQGEGGDIDDGVNWR